MSKATATATLRASGKTEAVALQPAAGGAFNGKGGFKATKRAIYVITLTLPDHKPRRRGSSSIDEHRSASQRTFRTRFEPCPTAYFYKRYQMVAWRWRQSRASRSLPFRSPEIRKNREISRFPSLIFHRRSRKSPLLQRVTRYLAPKLTGNFERGSGKPYRGTGTTLPQNRDR